jgi:hypothetical protein
MTHPLPTRANSAGNAWITDYVIDRSGAVNQRAKASNVVEMITCEGEGMIFVRILFACTKVIAANVVYAGDNHILGNV